MTKQKLKKFFCLALALYFTLFSTFSYAKDISTLHTTSYAISPFKSISIPQELGKSRNSFFGSKKAPLVIHIQDAHGQIQSQEKIQSLLSYLSEEHGFNHFFFEGALSGGISKDLLRFFSSQESNENFAQLLLEKGLIGGPEKYLLSSQTKQKAYGVEEASVYRDNLISFQTIHSQQELAQNFLSRLKKEILFLGDFYFNPKLKDFLHEWYRFLDKRSDLLSHLNQLAKSAKKELNLDLSNPIQQIQYPNLVRVYTLQRLQKELKENKQLEEQKQQFYQWLSQNSLEDDLILFQQLLDQEASVAPENVRQYLEDFYLRSESLGFSFEGYPVLTRLLGYLMLSQEIENTALFQEVLQITDRILSVLATSEKENQLIALFKNYLFLSKLFSLELTSQESEKISESISPVSVVSKLKQFKPDVDFLSSEVNTLFSEVKRFYDLAKRRDEIIFQNMLSQLKEKKIEKAILITGGFHSLGIQSRLKSADVAYLEVQPQMAYLEDKSKYIHSMLLQSMVDSMVPAVSLGKTARPVIEEALGNSFSRFHQEELEGLLGKFISTSDRVLKPGPAIKIHQFEVSFSANALGNSEKDLDPLKEQLEEFKQNSKRSKWLGFQQTVSNWLANGLKELLRKIVFFPLLQKIRRLVNKEFSLPNVMGLSDSEFVRVMKNVINDMNELDESKFVEEIQKVKHELDPTEERLYASQIRIIITSLKKKDKRKLNDRLKKIDIGKLSSSHQKRIADKLAPTIEQWLAKKQWLLRWVYPFFINYPEPGRGYARNLVMVDEKLGIRIFTHVWAANGGKARMHNHAGLLAVVSPFREGIVEEQFEMKEDPSYYPLEERYHQLTNLGKRLVAPLKTEAITRGRGGAIHTITNEDPHNPVIVMEAYFGRRSTRKLNNPIPVESVEGEYYFRRGPAGELSRALSEELLDGSRELTAYDREAFIRKLKEAEGKKSQLLSVRFPVFTTDNTAIKDIDHALWYVENLKADIRWAATGEFILEPTLMASIFKSLITEVIPPKEVFPRNESYTLGPKKTYLDKITPQFYQYLEAATQDLNPNQKHFAKRILEKALKRDELKGLTAFDTERIIYEFIREMTGNVQPYKKQKHRVREEAIKELIPFMEKAMRDLTGGDLLEKGIYFSASGNRASSSTFTKYAFGEQEALQEHIRSFKEPLEFSVSDHRELVNELSGGPKEVALFVDNAIEVVQDMALVKALLAQGHTINIIVRDEGVDNDVSIRDLKALLADSRVRQFLNLNSVTTQNLNLIPSGSRSRGVDLRYMSDELNELWGKSPVLIAKGEASRSTLTGIAKDFFSIFVAKHKDLNPDVAEKKAVVMRVLSSDSRKAIRSEVFHHINGIMIGPTMNTLWKRGVMGLFFKEKNTLKYQQSELQPVSLSQMASKEFVEGEPEHHMGNILGAMRTLALQGWFKMEGRDENTVFHLTEQGRRAVVLTQQGVFETSIEELRYLKNLHQHMRAPPEDGYALKSYQLMIERSKRNWILPKPNQNSDSVLARVLKQIHKHLDGVLMSPTIVALAMPLYKEVDIEVLRLVDGEVVKATQKEIRPVGKSVFQEFDPETYTLDLNSLDPEKYNIDFLRLAFNLLHSQGLVVFESKDIVRLTAKGRTVAIPPREDKGELAVAYGVTNSYLKAYERLPELLFINPEIFNFWKDEHIDRVMDIWGSGGSHKAYLPAIYKVLKQKFDSPLDQQPVGTSDMGSGSGDMSKEMVRYILKHTKRGGELQNYLLTVIAADYSPKSQGLSRATLNTAFSATENVEQHVLFGDITNPDQFAEDIDDLDLYYTHPTSGKRTKVRAEDLMHITNFIPHERALTLNYDAEAKTGEQIRLNREQLREKSFQIIKERLKKISPKALQVALEPLGVELPKDKSEWLDLIVDQFTTAYSSNGRLVPGVVQAADLIQFMQRWSKYTKHGFLILDLHTPRTTELLEEVPADPDKYMKVELVASPAYWGTHWLSQLIMPQPEYHLAMVLAGLEANQTNKYGRPTNVSLTLYKKAGSTAKAASLGFKSRIATVEVERSSGGNGRGRSTEQKSFVEATEVLKAIEIRLGFYERLLLEPDVFLLNGKGDVSEYLNPWAFLSLMGFDEGRTREELALREIAETNLRVLRRELEEFKRGIPEVDSSTSTVLRIVAYQLLIESRLSVIEEMLPRFDEDIKRIKRSIHVKQPPVLFPTLAMVGIAVRAQLEEDAKEIKEKAEQTKSLSRSEALKMIVSGTFHDEHLKMIQPTEGFPIIQLEVDGESYSVREIAALTRLKGAGREYSVDTIQEIVDAEGFEKVRVNERSQIVKVPRHVVDLFINSVTITSLARKLGVSADKIRKHFISLEKRRRKKVKSPVKHYSDNVRLIPFEIAQQWLVEKTRRVSGDEAREILAQAGFDFKKHAFNELIRNINGKLGKGVARRFFNGRNNLVEANEVYGRPQRFTEITIENLWRLVEYLNQRESEIANKVPLEQVRALSGLSQHKMIYLIALGYVKAKKESWVTFRAPKWMVSEQEFERLERAVKNKKQVAIMKALYSEQKRREESLENPRSYNRMNEFAKELEYVNRVTAFFMEFLYQDVKTSGKYFSLAKAFDVTPITVIEIKKRIRFFKRFINLKGTQWKKKFEAQLEDLNAALEVLEADYDTQLLNDLVFENGEGVSLNRQKKGLELRRLRNKELPHWTQKEVAIALGISPNMFKLYEMGRSEAPEELLGQLRDYVVRVREWASEGVIDRGASHLDQLRMLMAISGSSSQKLVVELGVGITQWNQWMMGEEEVPEEWWEDIYELAFDYQEDVQAKRLQHFLRLRDDLGLNQKTLAQELSTVEDMILLGRLDRIFSQKNIIPRPLYERSLDVFRRKAGEQIREVREEFLDLSTKVFAAELGVSSRFLLKLESGKVEDVDLVLSLFQKTKQFHAEAGYRFLLFRFQLDLDRETFASDLKISHIPKKSTVEGYLERLESGKKLLPSGLLSKARKLVDGRRKSLARRLKSYRSKTGLSPKKFIEIVNVEELKNTNQLTRMESGKTEIPPIVMLAARLLAEEREQGNKTLDDPIVMKARQLKWQRMKTGLSREKFIEAIGDPELTGVYSHYFKIERGLREPSDELLEAAKELASKGPQRTQLFVYINIAGLSAEKGMSAEKILPLRMQVLNPEEQVAAASLGEQGGNELDSVYINQIINLRSEASFDQAIDYLSFILEFYDFIVKVPELTPAQFATTFLELNSDPLAFNQIEPFIAQLRSLWKKIPKRAWGSDVEQRIDTVEQRFIRIRKHPRAKINFRILSLANNTKDLRRILRDVRKGIELKGYREVAGLSQKAFALLFRPQFRYTANAVSDMERGFRPIPKAVMSKAKVLAIKLGAKRLKRIRLKFELSQETFTNILSIHLRESLNDSLLDLWETEKELIPLIVMQEVDSFNRNQPAYMLFALRSVLDLDQKTFRKHFSGVRQQHYSQIESGEKPIPEKMFPELIDLMKTLGVDRFRQIRESLDLSYVELGLWLTAEFKLSENIMGERIERMETGQEVISARYLLVMQRFYQQEHAKALTGVRKILNLEYENFASMLDDEGSLNRRTVQYWENGERVIPDAIVATLNDIRLAMVPKRFKKLRTLLGKNSRKWGKLINPEEPISQELVKQWERGEMLIPLQFLLRAVSVYSKLAGKRVLSIREANKLGRKELAEWLDKTKAGEGRKVNSTLIREWEEGFKGVPEVVLSQLNSRAFREWKGERGYTIIRDLYDIYDFDEEKIAETLSVFSGSEISSTVVVKWLSKENQVPINKIEGLRLILFKAKKENFQRVRSDLELSRKELSEKLRPGKPFERETIRFWEQGLTEVPREISLKVEALRQKIVKELIGLLSSSYGLGLEEIANQLSVNRIITAEMVALWINGDNTIPFGIYLLAKKILRVARSRVFSSIRRDLNITQPQFARNLNSEQPYHRDAVRNWENGSRKIPQDVFATAISLHKKLGHREIIIGIKPVVAAASLGQKGKPGRVFDQRDGLMEDKSRMSGDPKDKFREADMMLRLIVMNISFYEQYPRRHRAFKHKTTKLNAQTLISYIENFSFDVLLISELEEKIIYLEKMVEHLLGPSPRKRLIRATVVEIRERFDNVQGYYVEGGFENSINLIIKRIRRGEEFVGIASEITSLLRKKHGKKFDVISWFNEQLKLGATKTAAGKTLTAWRKGRRNISQQHFDRAKRLLENLQKEEADAKSLGASGERLRDIRAILNLSLGQMAFVLSTEEEKVSYTDLIEWGKGEVPKHILQRAESMYEEKKQVDRDRWAQQVSETRFNLGFDREGFVRALKSRVVITIEQLNAIEEAREDVPDGLMSAVQELSYSHSGKRTKVSKKMISELVKGVDVELSTFVDLAEIHIADKLGLNGKAPSEAVASKLLRGSANLTVKDFKKLEVLSRAAAHFKVLSLNEFFFMIQKFIGWDDEELLDVLKGNRFTVLEHDFSSWRHEKETVPDEIIDFLLNLIIPDIPEVLEWVREKLGIGPKDLDKRMGAKEENLLRVINGKTTYSNYDRWFAFYLLASHANNMFTTKEWVRILRKFLGLKQRELASAMGVHFITIRTWEGGVSGMREENKEGLIDLVESRAPERIDFYLDKYRIERQDFEEKLGMSIERTKYLIKKGEGSLLELVIKVIILFHLYEEGLKVRQAHELKLIRKFLGLTQPEMGEVLKDFRKSGRAVNDSIIGGWEREEKSISLWVIPAAFQVVVKELDGRLDEMIQEAGITKQKFEELIEMSLEEVKDVINQSDEEAVKMIELVMSVVDSEVEKKVERFVHYRAVSGLDRKDFAEELGLERDSGEDRVASWERGQTKMPGVYIFEAEKAAFKKGAERLRRYRRKVGASAIAFSRLLGIDKAQLKELERGKIIVDLKLLKRGEQLALTKGAERVSRVISDLDITGAILGSVLNPSKPVKQTTVSLWARGVALLPDEHLSTINRLERIVKRKNKIETKNYSLLIRAFLGLSQEDFLILVKSAKKTTKLEDVIAWERGEQEIPRIVKRKLPHLLKDSVEERLPAIREALALSEEGFLKKVGASDDLIVEIISNLRKGRDFFVFIIAELLMKKFLDKKLPASDGNDVKARTGFANLTVLPQSSNVVSGSSLGLSASQLTVARFPGQGIVRNEDIADLSVGQMERVWVELGVVEELATRVGALGINLNLDYLLAHLGITSGSEEVSRGMPVFTYESVLMAGQKDNKQLAGKVASLMKPQHGYVFVKEDRKPFALYDELKRQLSGRVQLNTLLKALVSEERVQSEIKDMNKSAPPVIMSALSDEGDLELQIPGATKIKMNIQHLREQGIDLIQVLGLVLRIAENPEAQQRLFDAVGFDFNQQQNYWTVGKNFTQALDVIYAEYAAANSLGRAA